MNRDHGYHQDHHDERARQNARNRQLDRERRRLAALVQQPHEYRDHLGRRVANEDIARGDAW